MSRVFSPIGQDNGVKTFSAQNLRELSQEVRVRVWVAEAVDFLGFVDPAVQDGDLVSPSARPCARWHPVPPLPPTRRPSLGNSH
jgi:hypothetical protein